MISGNALEQDYSSATVFYLYLIPRGLRIILPVLKALGKPLRVITYMAPFPESEVPIETFQVTSVRHPDAQWPLFLYDILPDGLVDSDSSQEVSDEIKGEKGCVESERVIYDSSAPSATEEAETTEAVFSIKPPIIPP
jgi:hypothetical protein